MKRWLALFLIFALVLSPFGFGDHVADAKRMYKSGIKSFDGTSTIPKNNVQNNISKTNTVPQAPVTTGKTATATKGSFVKGMIMGGLAGLLLGSLIDDLGFFGTLLALFINLLFIVLVIFFIRKFILYMKKLNKEKEKDYNPWRS